MKIFFISLSCPLELLILVILGFIKLNLTIQSQQVFTDPKMIAKCFRGQNRDMQKFSWDLDNFKFGAEFER